MLDSRLKPLIEQMRVTAGTMRDAALTKAKEEIEAQFTTDMQAIERLMVIASHAGKNGSAHELVASTAVSRVSKDKIGATAAARESVAQLADGFTTDDVKRLIAKNHPNAKFGALATYSAMNKLKQSGEIEVMKKNQGREPGTYRRTKSNQIATRE